MKKETIFSILLLVMGFVFEYLYLGTDQMFFIVKFWILGIICMIAGTIGIILFGVLPLLEHRAEILGKHKKDRLK